MSDRVSFLGVSLLPGVSAFSPICDLSNSYPSHVVLVALPEYHFTYCRPAKPSKVDVLLSCKTRKSLHTIEAPVEVLSTMVLLERHVQFHLSAHVPKPQSLTWLYGSLKRHRNRYKLRSTSRCTNNYSAYREIHEDFGQVPVKQSKGSLVM